MKKFIEKLKDLMWDIRYYVYTVPKDYYYKVKWFFSNLKRFWTTLWEYRTWDYAYSFILFADSLEWLATQIENGLEEERSVKKKVAAIKELASLIRDLIDENDFGLNYDDFRNVEEFNKEYIKKRDECLNKIHRIIKGQDQCDTLRFENYDEWVEKFDGTGYEGWWE